MSFRSTGKQRHKPLAKAVNALHQTLPQGCSGLSSGGVHWKHTHPGVTWGCYERLEEVCVKPHHGCTLRCAKGDCCGSETGQGFPNACQLIETEMPSVHAIFSSPQRLSKCMCLCRGEIRCLFLSLVWFSKAMVQPGTTCRGAWSDPTERKLDTKVVEVELCHHLVSWRGVHGLLEKSSKPKQNEKQGKATQRQRKLPPTKKPAPLAPSALAPPSRWPPLSPSDLLTCLLYGVPHGRQCPG